MKEAVRETGADASVIYVPAPFVLDSIVEAVDSGVGLIVVITEGVPTFDMLKAKRYLRNQWQWYTFGWSKLSRCDYSR